MSAATPAKQPAPARKPRFSVLFSYLKRYKGYLLWGGLVVVLANVLLLTNPYLIKLVYDRLEKSAPMDEITPLLWWMLVLGALAGLFRYFMRRTIIWMSRKLEFDLRNDLVTHLLKLSPSHYDNNRTGDIMARLTNDLEAVRMMAGPGIMQLTNTFVSVIVAIGFMVALSPRLTFYALIPSLILPFAVNRLGTLTHKKFTAIQEHFSSLTAAVQENLSGVRVVKAYSQESTENAAFDKMSKRYLELNMDMGRIMAAFFPLIAFVAGGLLLVVLYFGGVDVIEGRLSLGALVAFFVYLNLLIWPLMAVGWVVNLYQRGTASLDRLNEILHTPPEIKDFRPDLHAQKMKGKVDIRSLTFAYNDTVVLKDISVTIPSGTTLGILGATGSGKTTLVALLSRLYQVPRGHIFVDDIDVNDWELQSLRSQIGVATQEPFLFSATIAENIKFGNQNAPAKNVESAAELASLTKDIETFPNRFETIVGERGITLSGGQKQRTAISRAVLIEPSILILDDATSAVDTQTEDEINMRIQSRAPRCTTLIISHRVSSVKEAEQIIYLENGTIAERGTHEVLLAQNGRYAALYRAQLKAKELESIS